MYGVFGGVNASCKVNNIITNACEIIINGIVEVVNTLKEGVEYGSRLTRATFHTCLHRLQLRLHGREDVCDGLMGKIKILWKKGCWKQSQGKGRVGS